MKPESQRPQNADPLDALLREEAEYVADDGFTARVIQSLPPRRRRRPWRVYVLALAFVLGSLITLWAFPPVPVIIDLVRFGFRNPQIELLVFVPILAALGALGWTLYSLAAEED